MQKEQPNSMAARMQAAQRRTAQKDSRRAKASAPPGALRERGGAVCCRLEDQALPMQLVQLRLTLPTSSTCTGLQGGRQPEALRECGGAAQTPNGPVERVGVAGAQLGLRRHTPADAVLAHPAPQLHLHI